MDEPIFSALLSLLVAILWGINSIFVKKGMKGEDPMKGLFIRTLFAFPILLSFKILVFGFNSITIYFNSELFPLVILTSSLIVVGDGIFLLALKSYDVSQILPIASTYPLFTTLILIYSGVESVSNHILFGTAIIMLGVSVVTGSRGKAGFSLQTIFYGVSCAVCWGFSIFFVRKILSNPTTDPIGLTGIRTLFMGIFAVLIFLARSTRKASEKRKIGELRNSIFYLSMSGVIGWVFGASLFFLAVQRIGAAIPTPISSTNPIFASIIGLYLHTEQVNWKQFIGIILTVIGTIIIVS